MNRVPCLAGEVIQAPGRRARGRRTGCGSGPAGRLAALPGSCQPGAGAGSSSRDWRGRDPMGGSSDSGYQFGSGVGDEELARLEAQSRSLAAPTRMILAGAGIRPGMRVLDLGCGAGDVAFLSADLVGADGSVVGVDRSLDALARARLRAGQRGLAQVQFVEGDVNDPAPGGPFDAIVERLVLWTVPDPAALLR